MCQLPRLGKFISPESRLEGTRAEEGGMQSHYLVGIELPFGVMKTSLKLIVVMAAQHCEWN